MRHYIYSLFLALLLFSGCSPKPIPDPVPPQPEWISKPSLNGKIGAVGSSRPQFKGKTVQRRVAVSRALDELAQQSGVRIENIVMRNEKSSGLNVSASTQVISTQEAAGVTINAHIQEVWTNPRTNEMYIWLLAD